MKPYYNKEESLGKVRVCKDCHGQVKDQRVYDEVLSVCQVCNIMEQETYIWTEEEFEVKGSY